jgi:hypothetical protein
MVEQTDPTPAGPAPACPEAYAILKCFRVEFTGFEDHGESVTHVAAKSRSSARFVVAESMAENYYHDMRKMGHCLSLIRSVRRAPDFDQLIDQRVLRPRFIHPKVDETK